MTQMAPATSNNRKLWFGSLLLLTVLAALWPVSDHEPLSPETRRGISASRNHDQAATTNVAFAPLAGATAKVQHAATGDLFPSQSWMPPPPPPSPPAPAVQPQPVAPPLPFTFGGRYTDENRVIIYLIEGSQMYKVQQGETVKGTYRVEKIEQTSVLLTYLPLGTTQILPTGVLLP